MLVNCKICPLKMIPKSKVESCFVTISPWWRKQLNLDIWEAARLASSGFRFDQTINPFSFTSDLPSVFWSLSPAVSGIWPSSSCLCTSLPPPSHASRRKHTKQHFWSNKCNTSCAVCVTLHLCLVYKEILICTVVQLSASVSSYSKLVQCSW